MSEQEVTKVYALKVKGNSLEGDGIQPDDIVLVLPDAPFINGKLYAVRLGNEVVARHVQQVNGTIRLIASNGLYKELQPYEIEKHRVASFGHTE